MTGDNSAEMANARRDVDIAADNRARERNAKFAAGLGEENIFHKRLDERYRMRTALVEAERFLDYFANGPTSFVGPGTPQSALAMVRAAIFEHNNESTQDNVLCEVVEERDALDAKMKQLTTMLDDLHVTHCEQIRHFCKVEALTAKRLVQSAREAGAQDMRERAAELARAAHAIEWEKPVTAFAMGYISAADELATAISALDPKGDRP